MTDRPRRDRFPEEDRASGPPPREAYEEVTAPPTDPVREAKQRDVEDPADVDVDPEEWRQGGPTRSPGARTTTGGTAGPAMRRRPNRPNEGKTAPTTTGDATSGGMDPPTSGITSDASGSPPPDGEGKEPD